MKNLLIVGFLVFLTGCTTGGTKYIEIDGGVLRMDTAAHTGIATQGATYTSFSRYNADRANWEEVGKHIGANPTILEQLAGPAAMVGSAYLIGEGLSDSGDEVNNTNQQAQAQGQLQFQGQQQRGGKRRWSP